MAELVSDLVARGLDERRWHVQVRDEQIRSADLGLTEDSPAGADDHGGLLRDKISQGLKSAQRGWLVDGDAVFARLMGELDLLPPPE